MHNASLHLCLVARGIKLNQRGIKVNQRYQGVSGILSLDCGTSVFIFLPINYFCWTKSTPRNWCYPIAEKVLYGSLECSINHLTLFNVLTFSPLA